MKSFKELLTEESSIPSFSDEDAIRDFKYRNTTIGYRTPTSSKPYVEIFSIRTPTKYRNQGSAKEALTKFLQFIDKEKLNVKLLASALDKKTNTDKLIAFYEKYGFIRTPERGNMLGHPYMIRNMKEDFSIDPLKGIPYKYEYIQGTDPTWKLDSSGNPVVLIDPGYIQRHFERLSKEELDKALFDPFFGLFPHEVLEANISKEIAAGGYLEVLKRYPKHKPIPVIKQWIINNTPVDLRPFYGKDNWGKYENIGGEAHDIIVSPDRDAYDEYYSYIENIVDKEKYEAIRKASKRRKRKR